MLSIQTSSYATSRDRNLVSDGVTYYGILEDVLELHYGLSFNVVLFKCNWFNEYTTNGFKKIGLDSIVSILNEIDIKMILSY